MPRLRISDLLIGSVAHLDEERIERYAQALDELPPVVVFDTGTGLLLVDGYHRVAAARRRGEETVDAEIRQGSRQDALRYAATVGAAQHGISETDAMARIRARGRGESPR